MNTSNALRAFLLADPAIAAIISTRMYPVQLPQNPALPAIRYFRVSGNRPQSTTGPLGQTNPRVQIDCYALKFQDANDLAELVRKRLDGYRGPAGDDGDFIQGAFFQTERDLWEEQPLPGMYAVSRDYMIWFREET